MKRVNRLRKRSIQTIRPSIPIPCMLAVACMIGVFLAGVIGEYLDVHAVRFALLVGSGFVVILAVIVVIRREGFAFWVAGFLILGMLLGLLQLAALEQVRSSASTQTQTYHFVLSEDAKDSTYGSQAVATIAEGPDAGRRVLLFTKDKADLLVRDHVVVNTRLSVPDNDHASYYDHKNIAFSARLESYQRIDDPTWLSPICQLRKDLLAAIGSGSDEQTLLRAVLLGERRALFDASFYHGIKMAGLAHLVAVSGAHLVIVTGFVTLLLRKLRVPAKLSVALQTLFLVIYLILVGFPISCIRAALMSGIALFALLVKRRSSSLTALGITVLLMVVFDPSVVYQLSFQLSVAATLGIVLFMPLFNEWFVTLVPKLPEFVRESISMTLAALIFSLPISVAQFSTIPLISPLTNIIATPYLSLILMLGFASLLLCVVLPGALTLTGFVASGMIALFSLVERIPFASLPSSITIEVALPLALGLAILLWLWWPTPRRHKRAVLAGCASVLALMIVFSCCSRFLPLGDRIIMLDVGQGDSFALVSEGKTLLVDTGNEQQMLYAALARNRIAKIDAVLITHPDDDHCGNLVSLNGIVEVGEILIAEGLGETDDEKVRAFFAQVERVVGRDRILEVGRGDTIRFGIFTLDIVAPVRVEHEGGNEDSICFYARADCDRDGQNDWSAFFCGDAEADVLEELASEQLLEQVDIYKVGHHGSRKALTPELARTLSPKASLIGVGENSYGHPTEETLESLEAVGSRIYRSDLCGDVVCSFSPDALEVSTQRGGG